MSVKIKCLQGKMKGKLWNFNDVGRIIIGRDKNVAKILIPEDKTTVSRWNSVLELAPGCVVVRDIGSLNGTYIDGRLIGKRDKNMDVFEARKKIYEAVQVENGTRISIGGKYNPEVFEVIMENGESETVALDDIDIEEKSIVMDDYSAHHENEQIMIDEENIVDKKLIGGGAFGRVYCVRDRKTGKQIAMKEMIPERRVQEREKEWFLREGKIGVQLRHPHIVRTYDIKFSGTSYKIYMEYCKGGNLEEYRIKKGGKLDLFEASNIILQMLDALDYIHNTIVNVQDKDGNVLAQRGIVHRDIKPENIFFTDSTKKIIKIGDFGLAKAFELSGHTIGFSENIMAGSINYCSRRQWINYRYSKPDVDVFAVAACFYRLLTGKPVRDNYRGNDFEWILKNPIVPIRQRDSSIPLKVANAIDKVLQEELKPEGARMTMAREFKREIENAI